MTNEIKDVQDAIKILERAQTEVFKEYGSRSAVWNFIFHAYYYLTKREDELFRQAIMPPPDSVKPWWRERLNDFR